MGGGVTLALAHDQVEPHLAIFRGWNSLALWFISKAGTRKPREGRQEQGLGLGFGAGIGRNREHTTSLQKQLHASEPCHVSLASPTTLTSVLHDEVNLQHTI